VKRRLGGWEAGTLGVVIAIVCAGRMAWADGGTIDGVIEDAQLWAVKVGTLNSTVAPQF